MRRSTRCRRSEKMRGDSLAPVEVKAARGTLCAFLLRIHQAGRARQVYKFLIYSLPKIRCGRWQQYGILDYMYEFANS